MRFLTIFPPAQNVHLTKGVGMIPYHMHRQFGYDSVLVCYKNDQDHRRISDVPGLSLLFLDKPRRVFGVDLTIIKYLFFESTSIDVLNLYHLKTESFIYGFLYKIRNRSGLSYLKLDVDLRPESHRKNITFFFKRWAIRKIDLVSAETYKAIDFIQEVYNPGPSLFRFPTGMDDQHIPSELKSTTQIRDKEQIMITVGRIGSTQKNNQMLLRALEQVDLKDWKVLLIGPIENNFQDEFNSFLKKNPSKINRVSLIGEVKDRNELFRFMYRSKVFISTSDWEGFGSAMIESLYFGNYLITTDVESSDDISGFGKCGTIIKRGDDSALTEIIQSTIEEETILDNACEISQKHIKDSFLWKNLIEELKSQIDERRKIRA